MIDYCHTCDRLIFWQPVAVFIYSHGFVVFCYLLLLLYCTMANKFDNDDDMTL